MMSREERLEETTRKKLSWQERVAQQIRDEGKERSMDKKKAFSSGLINENGLHDSREDADVSC